MQKKFIKFFLPSPFLCITRINAAMNQAFFSFKGIFSFFHHTGIFDKNDQQESGYLMFLGAHGLANFMHSVDHCCNRVWLCKL